MTKEEKAAVENLTKETKAVNVRLDRLIRQIEIANVIEAKKNGIDFKTLIESNDEFETLLKKHAVDIMVRKNKKEYGEDDQ